LLIESIRSQEKISEYPELSTGGKNVSTGDQNVSTVSQNVSTGDQTQHSKSEVSRNLFSLNIKYRNRVILTAFAIYNLC